jgi:predicted AlkP superfamily phosphohydrolase/phosphomutase
MRRVAVIGLDGGEPDLCLRWMREGRLPSLAALSERGAFMPLRSATPPATFPAWTSCVTGVNPGRHGVFDFTRLRPARYGLEFVNQTYRRAPALWNAVSQAGGRAGVLGVPGTYPPEPVNGLMVSGFDSPVAASLDPTFVYPRERYPDVAGWRFADFQENRVGPGWHEMALGRLLAKIDDKAAIAERLLKREAFDFFMAVFSESDTVSHHFWLFHDPESPRRREGPADAIRLVYERLDAAVGRLVEAAGDALALVVSDHGFGGTGTGVVHLNNWLAERGWLRFSGGGGSMLKAAALRFVPGRLQGAVFRRFRKAAGRAEAASRFGGIDWAHTRAYSEELNYFPSVRINLQGREGQGTVAPGDYGRVCDDLCAELEAWPWVQKAWRREELYHGPYVEEAPDIVLEMALEDGYSVSCLRRRGGPAFRRMRPGEYVGAREKGMSGSHRPDGILAVSEPVTAGAASIEDVAPTVLAAMGLPGPDMDGTPLLGEDPTGAIEPQGPPVASPYAAGQARAVEERLRDLGYFE